MNDDKLPLTVTEIREKMISSFIETTSSSREEAKSFLEAHQWDLYAAVSDFTEQHVSDAANLLATIVARTRSKRAADTPCESERIKRRELAGNKPTLGGSNDGGEQSDDVDEKDEESDVERPGQSSSRIVSAEPQMVITFFVTMWRNGYTVDGGPLHTSSDNTRDATLIETIKELESPRDLNPEDNQVRLRIKLIRRQDEDFNEPPDPNTLTPFQGVGRTTGEKDSAATESLTTTTQPSMSLVVDPAAPTNWIQVRLADGTRIFSRFSSHDTVRDIRGFVDACRTGGSNDYQLLVGFPPKPLLDFDQTIEEARISNSILIQRYYEY